MDATYEQLQKLTRTPNKSTHQLQQIRRADLVIQSQSSALSNAKESADKISRDYEKLIRYTKDAKARAAKSTVDNTDYVLQHTAELVDQQLRVLERTREILEDNKRL